MQGRQPRRRERESTGYQPPFVEGVDRSFSAGGCVEGTGAPTAAKSRHSMVAEGGLDENCRLRSSSLSLDRSDYPNRRARAALLAVFLGFLSRPRVREITRALQRSTALQLYSSTALQLSQLYGALHSTSSTPPHPRPVRPLPAPLFRMSAFAFFL